MRALETSCSFARAVTSAAFTFALFVACGGATAEVPASIDGGGSGDATSEAAPGADAQVFDVLPRDASSDAIGPNANAVTCGDVDCTRMGDGRSRQVCCVAPGLPPKSFCTPELDPNACSFGRRACDDSADCGGTGVCCAETARDGTMSTQCMPSCITGVQRWQVCKTTAECPGGIPCTRGICPRQGDIGFCVGAAIPDGCR